MYNKDIAAFILQWRFELKQRRVKKRQWRVVIAKKLMEHENYKKGTWTSPDFIDTWEQLCKEKRIFV